MKQFAAALLSGVACHASLAQSTEDFLAAPDRIEWTAGGLYDGRFEDGTPFQIELPYPQPASLPAEARESFRPSYRMPLDYTGIPGALALAERTGNTLHLASPHGDETVNDSVVVTLSPDGLAGQGNWNAGRLGQLRRFTLHRVLEYKSIVVTRPFEYTPFEGSAFADPHRKFVFAALFPVIGNPAVDAWIPEALAECRDNLECIHEVRVTWKSATLLSLSHMNYGYSYPGAHGDQHTEALHYRLKDGQPVQVGLDAFVDTQGACRATVSRALVAALRERRMSWAESGTLDKLGANLKFTATPAGIAFGFDPYQVGPYAEGAPTVFVPRAELGECVKSLPAYP